MKPIIRNLFFLLIVLSLINCNEEEITTRMYPRLKTLAVNEISSEGAKFNAEIIFRGDFEVINYGFVWSEKENPTKEGSDRVIYSENIETDNFFEIIETTLKEATTYYVRAFVETEDFTVYGQNVYFVSLGSKAPDITSFDPTNGTKGDTLVVRGRNFSYINNKVYFDNIEAKILNSTDTLLTVVVPDDIKNQENNIQIRISGNTAQANGFFTLLNPEIDKISSNSVKSYDELIIIGKNFGTKAEHIKVYFNTLMAEITAHSREKLIVIVPEALTEATNLKVQLGSLFDSTTINYLKPNLKVLDNASFSWGDEVNLHLQNGYQDTTLFSLQLNKEEISVNYASDSIINFFIPNNLEIINSELTLDIAGFKLKLDQPISLKPLNIQSFGNDSVGIDEEVLIYVGNLHPENNKVFINNLEIESTLAADFRSIKFKIPVEERYFSNTMTNNKIDIRLVANNTLIKDTSLIFKTPKITSINRQSVAIGDEVNIKGINFDPDFQKIRIMNEIVEIKSITTSEIAFIVPDIPMAYEKRNDANQISLELSLNEAIKIDTSLIIKAPIITGISPTNLNTINDIITVTGKNFGDNPMITFADDGGLFYNEQTKFEIDNSKIEVVSSSDSEITFRLINFNLQNDKITQYLSSKIKINSFGLHTISSESIFYEFTTNWKYFKVNPIHEIDKRRLFLQHNTSGFVLGGYKPRGNSYEGLRTTYQLFNNRNISNGNLALLSYPSWTTSLDPEFYVSKAFVFQDYLYVQTNKSKIRRAKIKQNLLTVTEWKDAPVIGNYSLDIRAKFEYNNELYLLSDRTIIRVSTSDTLQLSTFKTSIHKIFFTKIINDDFFMVIENRTTFNYTYELHRYNITNDFWELINDNYNFPSEKASKNISLANYVFDENYVYNYDIISGSKNIRFEFPENFTSQDQIELLFQLGKNWYFTIDNDQYLIYNEN